jgi:cytoplasmic iron level regulating protein YaaA (DUF328/UPF0246 family)
VAREQLEHVQCESKKNILNLASSEKENQIRENTGNTLTIRTAFQTGKEGQAFEKPVHIL